MPKFSDLFCFGHCCCKKHADEDGADKTLISNTEQTPPMGTGEPEGSEVYQADIPDSPNPFQ